MELDWLVGISTGMFFRFPLSQALEPIKKAGFNLIEVAAFQQHFNYHDPTEIASIKRQLDRLAIRVCSLHAPYSLELDLTSLQEQNRQRTVGEIEAAAAALSALQGHTLVLHAGSEEQHITDPPHKRLKQSVRSLKEIYAFCQEHNLRLAIEDMLAHLLGGRTWELNWLLEELQLEGLGMCLDTGHSFLSGSLAERVTAFASRLMMLHAHDNKGQYDDHLPPGEGTIDWAALLGALIASSFHGEIILEIGEGDNPLSSLQRARQSVAYLETCLKGKARLVL